MPRTISNELLAHLDGEALSLATCFRITRRDGELYRFTTTNVPLDIDGEIFEPLDAVAPTAVETRSGSGVDNLEIVGLLSNERITETDLRAGRFDGALVEMFVVNFRDLTQGTVELGRYRLGNITLSDGTFSAELRSLSQRLTVQTTDLVSPTCRVRVLGDSECLADLTGKTNAASILAVVDSFRFTTSTAGVIARAAGFFRYGTVTATSGENDGISREIKDSTLALGVTTIHLQDRFPFPLAPADTVELVVGCDRTFAQCVARFGNAENFRGEPHVPGVDKLMKTGRGGG